MENMNVATVKLAASNDTIVDIMAKVQDMEGWDVTIEAGIA
jgi:hypothetical protein